jgi:hypothetical protein
MYDRLPWLRFGRAARAARPGNARQTRVANVITANCNGTM